MSPICSSARNDLYAAADDLACARKHLAAPDSAQTKDCLKRALDEIFAAVGGFDGPAAELAFTASRALNQMLLNQHVISEALINEALTAVRKLLAMPHEANSPVCEHISDDAGACSQPASVRVTGLDEVRCSCHLDSNDLCEALLRPAMAA